MNDWERLSLKCGDLTLSAVARGDKDAPIVLCLHGWLDNAASFFPLLPYLTNKRVIAIDWPGHGLSDHRSAGAHYHFFDWVNDLFTLLKQNNWQQVDLIGHSMGGMVISAFAAAFPEKVRSLTLIDIVGFITAEPKQTTQQLRKSLFNREQADNKGYKRFAEKTIAVKAKLKVSDLNRTNAELLVERNLILRDGAYIWRYDKRLMALSPYRMTLAQAKQLIKDIHSPVLLIRGDKGLASVKANLEDYSACFTDLNCQIISGGHHIHMEQPQVVADLINRFISN